MRARSCWSAWPGTRSRGRPETTIAEALDGHLCRCTGYIKYHEAIREVILTVRPLPCLEATHPMGANWMADDVPPGTRRRRIIEHEI